MTTPGPSQAGRRAAAGACAGLALAAVAWSYFNSPTGAPQTSVRIDGGMSARAIGQRLEELGLIRSALLFETSARLLGLDVQLEAGNYRLDGQVTTAQLLRQLLRAPAEMVRVTVPEGLTRQQTAALLGRLGIADSARFVADTEREDLVADLGIAAATLEGYLFPETYFFAPGITEEQIARHMVAEFFEVFADSLFDRLDAVHLSLHQAVTLASMVEREAMVAAERPIIASIFQRRLLMGHRLESCTTVEYALGVHRTRLTSEDLKVRSPYNTYLHAGLPPGPIGSPGQASLLAALYPADTDYLYFVARGDGTHEFSRTHREHEAAKRALRQRERASAANL